MIDGETESLLRILEFQGGETLKLKVDAAQTEGGRGVMIKKRRGEGVSDIHYWEGEGDQCQGGWFGSSSSIHLCIEKKKKQAAALRQCLFHIIQPGSSRQEAAWLRCFDKQRGRDV